MGPEVSSSEAGNGDSDSQSQATEADSGGKCETSEVPVKNLTWSDAGSSDESSVDFCSLNVSVLRGSLVVSLVTMAEMPTSKN